MIFANHCISTFRGGFCQPPQHWPSGEDGGEGPAPGEGTVSPAAGGDKPGSSETDNHVHGANGPDNRFFDKGYNCFPVTSNRALKKQEPSDVFKESSIVLTKPMINLLNQGLKFAILPFKLDITQPLVELKQVERSRSRFGREKRTA